MGTAAVMSWKMSVLVCSCRQPCNSCTNTSSSPQRHRQATMVPSATATSQHWYSQSTLSSRHCHGSRGYLGWLLKNNARPQKSRRSPESRAPAWHPGGLQPIGLWGLRFRTSNNPHLTASRTRWLSSLTCTEGILVSALPSTVHSLSKIGGGQVTRRLCNLDCHGRWGSPAHSRWPCSLCVVASWRAPKMRNCSLSPAPQWWVLHATKGRKAMSFTVQRRGGRNVCVPQEGNPPISALSLALPAGQGQAWVVGPAALCLPLLGRFPCTTLSVKKCFLMSSLNLLDAALRHSHASYHWISGRRDQHLPLHCPSSGTCREQ